VPPEEPDEQGDPPTAPGVTGSGDHRYTEAPGPGTPQNQWAGIGTGWAVVSTMLAALLVCGGIGWLLDSLLNTGQGFLAIGLVGGAAAGTYLVYLEHGRENSAGR
jgi:F0F1-type ATP synthase assembly protein I